MGDATWISGQPQQTINGLLDRRLEDDPDSEYLDVCGTKLSAAAVENHANRLANALTGLGVTPGSRVATLIENSPEALLSWYGSVRGSAVGVPINTAYKGEYLRHQLVDSGSRVLFVESELADRAARVVGEIPGLDHVVVVGSDAPDSMAGVKVHTWGELLQGDASRPPAVARPSDLA